MENQDNSTDESFFCDEGVDGGCEIPSYKPIEIRFQTLILRNCDKPWDWYKSLGYDKGWASRVRRGLIIPLLEDRIKIAQYFKTDSATIWTNSDLPHIRKLLKKQEREEKNNGK